MGRNDASAPKSESKGSGGFDHSEHLDPAEKDQAAEHSAPPAVVIHEIVRKDGEAELAKATSAILWSGLAAGLSMGFSFLALALIQSGLPDTPSRRLFDSAGYSVGFIIAVLGRQELFTESTLTAVLPFLVRRDSRTLFSILRFWTLVLSANIVGTIIFARLLAVDGLFAEPVRTALIEIAHDSVSAPFWPTLIKSIYSGWLIALMVWLLPSAKSARLLVIMLLTYVVAIGRFSHIIAGSVEASFAVFTGGATIYDYLAGFFIPTLIGNTVGGVALVALLNHAPLAPELQE
jgi:formate/nitrite transporter FocA (FNT family)